MTGEMVDSSRSSELALPASYTDYLGGRHNVGPITIPSDQITSSFRTTGRQSDGSLIREFITPTENGFSKTNPIDSGHPFFSRRRSQTLSHTSFKVFSTRPGYELEGYSGPLVPYRSGHVKSYPSVNPMTANEISLFGSRAIKATTPTRPAASLATTLGEVVRDGFPLISVLNNQISRRSPDPDLNGRLDLTKDLPVSTAGSEFLNYTFGWSPLVGDLIKLLKAVSNSYEIISQYVRDGQPGLYVRRRMQFEPVVDTGFTDQGECTFLYAQQILQPAPTAGVFTQEDSVRQLMWFSGAYKYFVDVDSSTLARFQRYAKEADKLLGLQLSAEVLWELTPWSWLLDWKVDIGTLLSNASNFQNDDLVLLWGYLMRRTDAVRRYVSRGPTFSSVNPGAVSHSFKVVQKERYKATPFGFGVTTADFSDQQWAILAALGLTKGDKIAW